MSAALEREFIRIDAARHIGREDEEKVDLLLALRRGGDRREGEDKGAEGCAKQSAHCSLQVELFPPQRAGLSFDPNYGTRTPPPQYGPDSPK